ncbi:MFS transporter [Roseateles sp. DAIF2]|uniref:MFS transporter n=1 Tax=Roseateles sp. DAIF2 TaxID=2714952 RepID=UPI0018A2BE5B|nr:MFS transporter [Roseateles sp. DAIF2]QPF74538.1 MFS transporter [Roseateles sp. DAIF2]
MSAVLAPPAGAAPLRHPQWLLLALCAIALMNTAGVAMPYPILAPIFVDGPPDAFTHWMGLPPKLLMGAALAANPLGILLGSLVLGPLSDRYGRRRLLLLCLLATLGWQLVCAAALELRHYPFFVLARFAMGLAEGSVAITRALLADHHPQLDRTRSFAWLNACLYGGWLLGPLLGGQALRWGEAMPFALAALALLPCLLVLLFALPAERARPAVASFWAAVREQQALGLLKGDALLRRLFWLQLAYTMGVHALYEFAPLWLLENLGLDGAGIAWVTAAQCATMVLASVLASRLPAARRPLRRAALLALLAALGLALLALLPGRWGMAVVIALGAPLALYNAVLPAWMSERFGDAHGQGRVMGLLSTVFCLANVLVALGGGALALLQTRWVMALGGLAACTAAWRLLRLARELRQ